MPLKGLRDADNLASIIPRGVSLSNNHLRCSVPLPPIAPPPHACQTFPPVTPPPWSDAASGGRGPAPSQAKPSIVKIPLSYFYELCPLGGPRKVFFFTSGAHSSPSVSVSCMFLGSEKLALKPYVIFAKVRRSIAWNANDSQHPGAQLEVTKQPNMTESQPGCSGRPVCIPCCRDQCPLGRPMAWLPKWFRKWWRIL